MPDPYTQVLVCCTACEASDKRYSKGLCAVGTVALSCMCATRVRMESFPSTCVATTNASLEASAERRVRAIALDAQVEQRFLEALRPDQVALALAALAQLEQEERAAHCEPGRAGRVTSRQSCAGRVLGKKKPADVD
jgi:hypothetical protein